MAHGPVREPRADVRRGSAGAAYRGRIAPTPTGLLHLGHYRTFRTAWERARAASGAIVLRIEDIDPYRCRPEFTQAAIEDLRWAGLDWDEGPDVGGPFAPYVQSLRLAHFRAAFERLKSTGALFACVCSRRDVAAAALAPHAEDAEPLYPGTCRHAHHAGGDGGVSWRFRVPDGESIRFEDGRSGSQEFVAGRDFGDFIVWRRDDAPAYELAVVVDDAAMGITEVVRGEDLLLSTARQLLLYRALSLEPPAFHHCPLVLDASGKRLAKRHESLGLRRLREQGLTPRQLSELQRDGP
jgi:glutamyl/glutaminyl-tRNA synthetase